MSYKVKSAFQKFATTAITLSGVVTAASIALSAQSAQALNISFGTTDFTVSGLAGSNNAAASTVINTQSPPAGFGNVFTSNFILLGANTSDTAINITSNTNGNSDATSYSFALSQDEVANPITLAFNWAFNGNSLGGTNDKDNFNITLIRTDGLDDATFFERTVDPADSIPGYGSGINQVGIIAANTLSAGNYQLVINLNENSSGRNSAAGFNNITFSAPVPFGFSTNTSLLVFGGVFYGFNRLKKRMVLKKSQG